MNTTRHAGIKAGERVSHPRFGPGRVTTQEYTATNGKRRVAVLTDQDSRIHHLDAALLTRLDSTPAHRPAMADDAYSGNPYLDSGLH